MSDDSVSYGNFRPRGASHSYFALKARTRYRAGQVVALAWEEVNLQRGASGAGHADGGCGLAAHCNGGVGTWFLPMQLAAGKHRFRFHLSASSCDSRHLPREATQTVVVRA
jgi:hypothetical protein